MWAPQISFENTCPDSRRSLTQLTALLRINQRWRWTVAEQQAFDAVKEALAKPLVLCRPYPGRPFVLQTDASQLGIAAVLYQQREDGGRDIVSYSSQRLTATESRYHVNEQEYLTIV